MTWETWSSTPFHIFPSIFPFITDVFTEALLIAFHTPGHIQFYLYFI